MEGNVSNELAETNPIEPARTPVPQPDPQMAVNQSTSQPSLPTKSSLKKPAGAPVPQPDPQVAGNQSTSLPTKSSLQKPAGEPVPGRRLAAAVHTVRPRDYLSLWNDLWIDENCRIAASSVVMCVLFTIAVVVSASLFYTTSFVEDGVPVPATESVPAPTNPTTTVAVSASLFHTTSSGKDNGSEPVTESVAATTNLTTAVVASTSLFHSTISGEDNISEPANESVAPDTNFTTAARDMESTEPSQVNLFNETSFSAPQKQYDSTVGGIENEDVVVARQHLENEAQMQKALVTSLEQATTERTERNPPPSRGTPVNDDTVPIVAPKSGRNPAHQKGTTDATTT